MAQMKTPGVYIIEKNAFPNSVVEVRYRHPCLYRAYPIRTGR